ncbi:MAG: septum formation inhibitor Maf [Magnetococcales bacterium]|nr:septum formation inhibitor Maf [Magnetococcales bacterium]
MVAPGLAGVGHVRLASASERRLMLLRQLGLEPEVMAVDIDESPHPGENPVAYCLRMARTKASTGHGPGIGLCLGADTVVIRDGEILGKPRDADEARRHLLGLSGRAHRVATAVAVAAGRGPSIQSAVAVTDVWFKVLTLGEIEAYLASGESMDKAGSYGIQGLGAFMVTRIEGSYTGVVGLPLFETVSLLRWGAHLYRLEGDAGG